MKNSKTIEQLEKELYHEKLINKVLMGENEELKKVIFGFKDYISHYSVSIAKIERFRKTILYRGLRKIKHIFRRG